MLIGRGATNSKGPELAYWNALMSIKAVTGTLPVNLIFVAEGDEERMDIGLRKFVKDHPDLFAGADALIGEGGGQNPERQRRRRRRLRGLRLHRADDQRQGVGPRPACSPTFTAPTSAASTARRGATSRCSRRWSPRTATRR